MMIIIIIIYVSVRYFQLILAQREEKFAVVIFVRHQTAISAKQYFGITSEAGWIFPEASSYIFEIV